MNNAQIKKVVVIGPECTGKSELSAYLSAYYRTEWVPEYARTYLDDLARPYEQHDLLNIARGQLELEDQHEKSAHDLLICDTNLYVIKIWSEVKYNTCDTQILQWIATRKYDLYLLTYVDIPWEEDPMREHPDKRDYLYQMYLHEMKNQSVPFIEIKGDRDNRRATAIKSISKFVMNKHF